MRIGPHLAYGDRGVPGTIPAGAALIAEITILEARVSTPPSSNDPNDPQSRRAFHAGSEVPPGREAD